MLLRGRLVVTTLLLQPVKILACPSLRSSFGVPDMLMAVQYGVGGRQGHA